MTPKAGKRQTTGTTETSLVDELDKIRRDRDRAVSRIWKPVCETQLEPLGNGVVRCQCLCRSVE